ncbi:hypothetical protein NE626_16045, partial [Intestinimonas massiliensis]|uniref:hypothetical protein n=1 Tax=Intestinimonas massiliensis (ex Afouda et al. 2020) TaxID=1673721 RepID=UPI002801383D|nr:hypothetical protein [Intestinimonas massiliensis (ex Afouda et al. 2020)]
SPMSWRTGAAAIGAEYTLVSLGHSGGLPLQERTRRLESSLLRLADAAQRLGHALVVENLTPWESDACTNLASYPACPAAATRRRWASGACR